MPVEKSSMPLACLRRASLAFAAVLSSWVLWVPARAADDTPSDDIADCIALFQTNADDLARQIKAGDKAREPALRSELRRAGVLIGRTYLDGMNDSAEAKARLKAAQERQATWDEERRKRVYQVCFKRADAELAAASGPERFIVERFVQVRFERLLKEP